MPLVDLDRLETFLGAFLLGRNLFSGALVSKVGNQLIPTGVFTTLTWDAEQYDVGDWFASSGDTFFTVPSGVTRVQLAAGVAWNFGTGTFRIVEFQKNGTVFPGAASDSSRTNINNLLDDHQIASPVIDVVPGDVFTIRVAQNTVGGLGVLASGKTFFGIRAIEGIATGVGSGADTFTALNDTPGSYVGFPGKVLQVNAAENALEFGQALRGIDEVTFAGLTLTGARHLSFANFALDASTLSLGRHELYKCIDTSASRTFTIQTADINTGVLQPWIFTIKDESGGANANNISIVTQGGQLIDGATSIAITEDYGSVTLYSNGTNLYSI